ncbi:hypothetical protein ABW21_db0205651 [Orbilia brochopaga]|nr:hypothetical protein ABW21_db0205651 [Drechslerella brochopaga]
MQQQVQLHLYRTSTTSGQYQIRPETATANPKPPIRAKIPGSEPDPSYYEKFKGQNQQIYIRNVADIKNFGVDDASLMTAQARLFFWTRDLINAEPTSMDLDKFVGDPARNSRTVANIQTDIDNDPNPVYCWAQPHSDTNDKGLPQLDPIMYCDETSFSIRLHTSRDTSMRIKCSAAAKIANDLISMIKSEAQGLSGTSSPQLPPQYIVNPIEKASLTMWETVGRSFWSEDPTWFVYIGKESQGNCKFPGWRNLWPALNEPAP